MFLLDSILSEVRISDQVEVVFLVPVGTLQNVQLRIAPMRLKHRSDRARAIFCWTSVRWFLFWILDTTLAEFLFDVYKMLYGGDRLILC